MKSSRANMPINLKWTPNKLSRPRLQKTLQARLWGLFLNFPAS
jgi:hypothetical protein